MVQEHCFLIMAQRRCHDLVSFYLLALLSFSEFMWSKDDNSSSIPCLKVQVHLGRILASVPKVQAKVLLTLMDHVPVPNVFERNEMCELV